MKNDVNNLSKLSELLVDPSPDNLGDIFEKAVEIRTKIGTVPKSIAEFQLTKLRGMVSRAELGWKLFSQPLLPTRTLSDIEILQLISVEGALRELCYCCERLEEAAAITWGGSSPTRFYINSIYHYVSSMFLVDTSKKTHKNLPMGGTIIRALAPIGLTELLDPINEVLQQPFGKNINFGDTILLLRHSHLVHGDFSPERIEYLNAQTGIRDALQQQRLADLIWDLFYQLILLDLKLIAVLTTSKPNVIEIINLYLTNLKSTF